MDLLILPDVDDPVTTCSETIRDTFQSIWDRSRPGDEDHPTRVDVALLLKPDAFSTDGIRSRSFPDFNIRIKGAYEAILAGGGDFQLDLSGIDARVFLLNSGSNEHQRDDGGGLALSGPLVDLQTLVQASRLYSTIYVTDEASLAVAEAVASLIKSKHSAQAPSILRLPSPIILTSTTTTPAQSTTLHSNSPPHHNVAVGGTFDHFHIGHKLLLSATCFIPQPSSTTPREITIGISGPALLTKKSNAALLEDWSTRQSRTESFVESQLIFHPDILSIKTRTVLDNEGPNGHVVRVCYDLNTTTTTVPTPSDASRPPAITINYTLLSDPFGPTITDESINAIIVSHETRAGGDAVNAKRREKGWNELEVFEVEVLNPSGAAAADGGDFGEGGDGSRDGAGSGPERWKGKIGSSEIRRRLAEAKGS